MKKIFLLRNCGNSYILLLWRYEFLQEKIMKENVMVSGRGQITLPAAIRKRLGIKPGGMVVLEEKNGEVVLRPGVVVEIETYTDADIAQWDEEDRLDKTERAALLKRLGKKT
jgi:AbrB family looped-hinge helix DNA binding protein